MNSDEKRGNEYDDSGAPLSPSTTEVDEGRTQGTAIQQLDTATLNDPENPLNWPLWVKVSFKLKLLVHQTNTSRL